ncbi:protein kinase domain-containing protein [Actinoplanes flavus]|uniref:non-specific serine/threonine protein kinase n=1 Tax=Actinoplanes flavus TaxID=2820290 RepID=A0ABS3UNA8_9ACTN|nr:serine/threonine-protein kinase [Actinoplanes flavus]MBO3739142.1 serine/threonine protein kinase [Actinoplanes flavus]
MDGDLDGRYRLLELVGTGGMGRVWRAEDTLLRRTVAVKEMVTPSSPRLAAQAVREARAAARLDHPGVVKVYDVGRSWIVMEYVPSRSLHQVVRDDGPLAPREAARVGLGMLAALRAAHAAGVLHRDVKPDNVLLAADGRVVLTDFGLASLDCGGEDGPDPRLGSPSYIAPERLLEQEAGVPGDLWSLGATLYSAVEGRAPFARDDGGTALRALLSDPPHRPVRSGPLAGLLLALLAKDPAARPTADQVEARLRVVLRGRSRRRLAAAVLLLAAGAAGVLPAAHRPAPAPAPAPAPSSFTALMSYQEDVCGGTAPQPVTAAGDRVPAGLPDGWVWTREPPGFALAVPSGWRRSMDGNEVCFSDPGGRRAFRVNVSPVVTRQPLAYWQGREKASLARGDLPGYQRISMGVLLLKGGGADWEYTWRPDSRTVRHERRVLVAVGSRSYLLRWTVADPDWAATTGVQRRMVELFEGMS